MDTKWKSTIKKGAGFMKENKRLGIAVLAAILTVIGAVLLYRQAGGMTTRMVWAVGLVLEVLCGFSLSVLIQFGLKQRYGSWAPKDGSDYEEWKKMRRQLKKYVLAVAIPALTIAILFFIFQLGGRYYYYYYYNYALSYFFIVSVFIQYLIAQRCVNRFMEKKMDLLMERMTEISRENLEAAIEIERQSIEKAAKSEQLKVDLISNVSHDLKTPLTSMVGYIELMKKEELDDVTRDYVDVISDKAEKLKEMIESLFSLAKASSGNIKLQIESVDMNMLIDQIFADMQSQIESSDLHFVKLLTEEDTRLETDNLHMYRICQNLIENALKYSACGTRVFVKTFVERIGEEENVCMEITNTSGYLMDFEKEDIVERFARGDKARSSEGNGLGLAIVSTYAGALGGAFDIHIDCDQFKAKLAFPRKINA